MKPLPFSVAELDALRAQTPACDVYAHFAHGSSSLPPTMVFDAQRAWLEAQELHGTYRALKLFKDELADVRRSVASLIGARENQIALLESSSRGWASAFIAACEAFQAVEVITTEHEWGANALNMLQARNRGLIANLQVLHDSDTLAARQTLARIADVPAGRSPLVALQAVGPIDGSRTDLAGIAQAVHGRGGLLFLDASHAVGQLPVDVGELGCDVLVFPARKWLRGPKGVSVLYLSDLALRTLGAPPTLDIAGARWQSALDYEPYADARRFEAYEFNPGTRLALKAACDYAIALGPERIAAQNRCVRTKVLQALHGVSSLRPILADDPTALMTFQVQESSAAQLLAALESASVNASLIDDQYSLWALRARSTRVLLRLTPHYFTSDEEIQRLQNALVALPDTFRLPA